MNRTTTSIVWIILALAAVALVVLSLSGTAPDPEDAPRVRSASKRSARASVRAAQPKAREANPKPDEDGSAAEDVGVETEPELTPAEQKIVDAIQDALDDEDFDKVTAKLSDAAASTNAAVRAKAVEALQWFGEKALPELTMFMADDDDDVRSSAIDAWTMGLSQLEAGKAKADTVRMGLSVVTDRDQLEQMVMQVDELSNLQKLDVLTQIIEGKNKLAAEVAREHYKFWTEEDYTDLAAAQKWLDEQEL